MTSKNDRFRSLLGQFETAVLITYGLDGNVRARPMAIASIESNCDLWFVTPEETLKVHDIENDSRIHVICQDGWNSCVSIAGRASLSRDRDRIRALWKPSYTSWHPGGPDDPNLLLIRCRGEHGEYWAGGGKEAGTFEYAARPANERRGHGEVDLSQGS
jgi:general stress protein 26